MSTMRTWTPMNMLIEKQRRQAEDIAALGQRPRWWRFRSRRRYDNRVLYLMKAHARHLADMLTQKDDATRSMMAHLLGWGIHHG